MLQFLSKILKKDIDENTKDCLSPNHTSNMNTTTVKQKREFRIVVGLIAQSGGYVKVEERLSFLGIPFWYSSQFGLFDTEADAITAIQAVLRIEEVRYHA